MATTKRLSVVEQERKRSISSASGLPKREEVEKILQMEPKDRTKRNIDLLRVYFKQNRFFRQQAEIYDEKTIQYLFRNLRFMEFKPKVPVFHYGDQGELFYIIMEGEVVIKTPAPDVIEDD